MTWRAATHSGLVIVGYLAPFYESLLLMRVRFHTECICRITSITSLIWARPRPTLMSLIESSGIWIFGLFCGVQLRNKRTSFINSYMSYIPQLSQVAWHPFTMARNYSISSFHSIFLSLTTLFSIHFAFLNSRQMSLTIYFALQNYGVLGFSDPRILQHRV